MDCVGNWITHRNTDQGLSYCEMLGSSLRCKNNFYVPEQCYTISEHPDIGYTAENIIYVNI